jgi:hypothetical protein
MGEGVSALWCDGDDDVWLDQKQFGDECRQAIRPPFSTAHNWDVSACGDNIKTAQALPTHPTLAAAAGGSGD